ncbi:MAG: hypothetical protein P9L94_13350 [Candidatus Hinthialibacter antarcticus]|nr:hypothetical protein [Candidatus Hinthialibacter antarcticus]
MPLPSSNIVYAKTIAFRVLLTLVLAAILFWLGQWTPYSRDSLHMADMAGSGWRVTMHSVLTSIVHRTVYLTLSPFGWDAWNALSMSSALAGAIALQVLFAFRRDPLFLAANILAGSFLVFVGEVENYAWVNLFLLLTFIWMRRFLQNGAPIWPALTCFFIAALFHMLAFFYLPAIFLAMRKRPIRAGEFLIPFGAYMLLHFACVTLLPHEGIELSLTRLVPLFETQRKDQWFTFLSWAHLEIKTYYHFQAGVLFLPLGWPIVIALRKRINSPFRRFMLQCALLGLAWNTLWHPDLGWEDWDLFSQSSIPLHFLAGDLLADWSKQYYRWRKTKTP